MKDLATRVEELEAQVEALRARCEAELERLGLLLAGHGEVLDRTTTLLESRNKSAPMKRNMTDADALRVLTGDQRELAHKEAADAVGLTYAQVYSCRMEFTFKHVHKDLRDSGWKNPFVKNGVSAPRA